MLNKTVVEEASAHRLEPYIKEILLEGGEYDRGLANAIEFEAALDAFDNKASQAELIGLRKTLNKVLKGDEITKDDMAAVEAAVKSSDPTIASRIVSFRMRSTTLRQVSDVCLSMDSMYSNSDRKKLSLFSFGHSLRITAKTNRLFLSKNLE